LFYNNGEILTSSTEEGYLFSTGPSYTLGLDKWIYISSSNISNLALGIMTFPLQMLVAVPITKTYTITEPNDIIIGTDLQKNVTCFNKADGSVKITVSSGTLNYSYSGRKTKPLFNLRDISNLAPGHILFRF
jgi:hypothetical protein